MGLADEIAARKGEKEAVAHILFNQMDADGSGSLDMDEVRDLCVKLGKECECNSFRSLPFAAFRRC